MTELTKFNDHLKNMSTHARHQLADAVQAAAEQMTPAERRQLLETRLLPFKRMLQRTARRLNVCNVCKLRWQAKRKTRQSTPTLMRFAAS